MGMVSKKDVVMIQRAEHLVEQMKIIENKITQVIGLNVGDELYEMPHGGGRSSSLIVKMEEEKEGKLEPIEFGWKHRRLLKDFIKNGLKSTTETFENQYGIKFQVDRPSFNKKKKKKKKQNPKIENYNYF